MFRFPAAVCTLLGMSKYEVCDRTLLDNLARQWKPHGGWMGAVRDLGMLPEKGRNLLVTPRGSVLNDAVGNNIEKLHPSVPTSRHDLLYKHCNLLTCSAYWSDLTWLSNRGCSGRKSMVIAIF